MTCNTIHLVEDSEFGCLALTQGESLNYPNSRALTFVLTGDRVTANYATYLSWTQIGQITSTYFDKNPTVYATFAFNALLYGTFTVSDGTTQTGIAVAPKLSFTQAKAIPFPKLAWAGEDAAIVGKNCWLYEIRLVSPDGTEAIDVVPPSYVQIAGRSAA